MIEIPLKHKETGEEFLFCAQSKTSLGAATGFPHAGPAGAAGV